MRRGKGGFEPIQVFVLLFRLGNGLNLLFNSTICTGAGVAAADANASAGVADIVLGEESLFDALKIRN